MLEYTAYTYRTAPPSTFLAGGPHAEAARVSWAAMPRDSKKPTLMPRLQRRTTRPPVAGTDASAAEPSTSTKPTRRDLSAVIAEVPATARGQFSIAAARSVEANVVSGSIEVNLSAGPRRRRPNTSLQLDLVMATKRELTVQLRSQKITLDRAHALALAELILDTFG